MVEGCSAHLHAVGEKGVTNCASAVKLAEGRAGGGVVVADQSSCTTIQSVDAGLVSVGQPYPYPTPLVKAPDDADSDRSNSSGGNGGQGIFFVLHSNLWDTNYPVWFPFGPEKRGQSMGFRFVVQVASDV